MDAYRSMQNGHAFHMLNKEVYIPDAQLAIGVGEDLTPQPLLVHYPTVQKQAQMPEFDSISYERSSIDGYAEPLSEKDFPSYFHFGNPIEGV